MDWEAIAYFISVKIVWSPFLIILYLAAGFYFSFRTGFLQLRMLPRMLRTVLEGADSSRGISAFQAFSMTISGVIGTGNIAGTAAAIYMGGPGALFWMWLIAFFGAASSFVEATLAQLWKVEIDGQYRGGPAYYIARGLGAKWYAILFALAAIPCCGLLLVGLQANNIAVAFRNVWVINPWVLAAGIAGLMAYIIFGGIRRIAKISQVLAPFMAGAYLLLALIIIALNLPALPGVLKSIFASALGLEPLFSGLLGSALAWGVKRGIFSNEAGQGTMPHTAAATEISHPAKQGLIQALAVYMDTLLICSATGFMILLTDCYNVRGPGGELLVNHLPQAEMGAAYAQAAVSTILPGLGGPLIAIFLGFFAFTSIPVYFYYAESNLAYIFSRGRMLRRFLTFLLRIISVVFVFFASVFPAEAAWILGDIGVGLMAWLNLGAIILLRKPALALLADFKAQLKAGKEPVFDPRSFHYPNLGLWRHIHDHYRRF